MQLIASTHLHAALRAVYIETSLLGEASILHLSLKMRIQILISLHLSSIARHERLSRQHVQYYAMYMYACMYVIIFMSPLPAASPH